MGKHILAIDQGTSSTKTILFDETGKTVFKASVPLNTSYLEGYRVEQIPEEIYENVKLSVKECLEGFKAAGGIPAEILACGISNQRETFVLWDQKGQPLYNAIVWQCKRSVDVCSRLRNEGLEPVINEKTGLIIDPYFSGSKVIWLYENEAKVRQAVDEGNAYFGTVDSWLLYKLTKGERYLTDYTNASRTMFFNLNDKTWDQDILHMMGLSKLNLPDVKSSAYTFGMTDFDGLLEKPVKISSMIGDSHAAAFGEGLYLPGMAKATLGTGCSVLMNVGHHPNFSTNGMVSTICWSLEKRTDFALEGIIVSCGATIEWLKNELGLFHDASSLEKMNASVKDNNGVYLVPAFSGLGAPHWQMDRKASLVGLSFDCNKNHIVRAALESIAYQIKDVIVAMEQDSGVPLKKLQVDGGITSNRFVMQFLADLLNREVVNIGIADVSALGAAYIAGLHSSVFKDINQLQTLHQENIVYQPGENRTEVDGYYAAWQNIISVCP